MVWPDIRFFKPFEFDSPDLPGSGDRMELTFVRKLDTVHALAGIPLGVASGYRTPEHNQAVGGEPNSAHLTGEAADLRAVASRTRYRILSAAMTVGFNRIGIGDTFIHLDDSAILDQQVVWLYPPGTKKSAT